SRSPVVTRSLRSLRAVLAVPLPSFALSSGVRLLPLPCFFFNETATTEIYTLSLHDALPIFRGQICHCEHFHPEVAAHSDSEPLLDRKSGSAGMPRPISYAVFCLKKKNRRKGVSRRSRRCRRTRDSVLLADAHRSIRDRPCTP